MIYLGIIKQRNKVSGVVYVFENEKYWDETQKKYKYRKKSIGKLDPNTGKIIPAKNKRGRKHQTQPQVQPEVNPDEFKKLNRLYNRSEERVAVLRNRVKDLTAEVVEQDKQIQDLTRQNKQLTKAMNVIRSAIAVSAANLTDETNPSTEE